MPYCCDRWNNTKPVTKATEAVGVLAVSGTSIYFRQTTDVSPILVHTDHVPDDRRRW